MSMNEKLRRILYLLPMPLALMVEEGKRAVFPPFGYRRSRELCFRLGQPTAILAGPFEGMRYISQSHGSPLLPKIVGTYELELHDVIARLCALPLDLVIDVGAAEGYYAVGFARRLPAAKVIGFDINKRARYLLGELARMNGMTDRVAIRTEATPASLESELARSTMPLVLCDCEGAEVDILVPARTPSLKRSYVLVETHDGMRAGATAYLKESFSPTHDIEVIPVRKRNVADLPARFRDWSADDQHPLMHEGRTIVQDWLFMTPRAAR